MKKVFYLICFLLGFGVISQAQHKKSQAPKVNLESFTPTSKSTPKSNQYTRKGKRKDIPKVDLTNFKSPVNANSKTKKE